MYSVQLQTEVIFEAAEVDDINDERTHKVRTIVMIIIVIITIAVDLLLTGHLFVVFVNCSLIEQSFAIWGKQTKNYVY